MTHIVHYGWMEEQNVKATLCGRASKFSILSEDERDVTCKLCLRVLAADRDEWNK